MVAMHIYIRDVYKLDGLVVRSVFISFIIELVLVYSNIVRGLFVLRVRETASCYHTRKIKRLQYVALTSTKQDSLGPHSIHADS